MAALKVKYHGKSVQSTHAVSVIWWQIQNGGSGKAVDLLELWGREWADGGWGGGRGNL